MLTYKMLNAYPTNLTALPVTYEGSTVTKTTVTFAYDRYVILRNARSDTPVVTTPQITAQ